MSSIPPVQLPLFPLGKCCKTCGETKPLDEFYSHLGMADGHLNYCKSCKRSYARVHRDADLDGARERDRVRWPAKKERTQDSRVAYRVANRETELAKHKEYYQANSDHVKARVGEYFAAHREEANARRRAYYDAHKAEHSATAKAWRLSHQDACNALHQTRRARKSGNGGVHTAAEWNAIKQAQDYRCLACGRQEPDITLTRDHVLPLSKGGRNDAANLQGLCLPCNLQKQDKHIDYRT